MMGFEEAPRWSSIGKKPPNSNSLMLNSESVRPRSVLLTDLDEGYPTILKQFRQPPTKRWATVGES